MAKKTPRLGKGLNALLGEFGGQQADGRVEEVKLDRLKPNPFQPRREFAEEKLEELAESIRVHGVVQPVIIRETEDGYELVAGERRWRAAELAGLDTIPAIVSDHSDRDLMEIALIENLQREDLSPIEQATAYEVLQREFSLTQQDLAARLGVSRSQVANVLRLRQLPGEIQNLVQKGALSLGHGKVILGVPSEEQIPFAHEIAQRGLSVREAERWIARRRTRQGAEKEPGAKKPPTGGQKRDPFTEDVEKRLRRALGTPVSIQSQGQKGRIVIEYYDHEDLDRLLEIVLGE